MIVKTTGKSGLVCWTNHASSDPCSFGHASFELPAPDFEQRVSDVEARPMQLPRVRRFVALWLWLFGARDSAHAVFASEPPVRPGEMRKRPDVLWPRVVTMRWVAGGLRVHARRLIAWRERRASLLEVVRHHSAAVYQKQAPKLAAWLRGAR